MYKQKKKKNEKVPTPSTQEVDWTYIRRSKDNLNVFWTSSASLIYTLHPGRQLNKTTIVF